MKGTLSSSFSDKVINPYPPVPPERER